MNAPLVIDTSRPVGPAGLTLASLQKDVPARVVEVPIPDQPALAEHANRLMELGFIPGASVRVVAAAPPSGDPVAVRIGRATFALRLFEAELVRVAVASSGPG
jgi:ferrous iron transport protein A